MKARKLPKQPLVVFFSLLRFSTSPLVSLCFVLLFGRRISVFAEKPAVAFHWGAIGGCYEAFSSSYIRRAPHQTTPVSGGVHNMNDLVEIRAKPSTLSPSFDELHKNKL